ncbi:FAD-dependent oxidoreductase [Deinococcus cellulosilyticus]|uniref:Glycine oxidase ThiO n=1 Tax=Deinococcus cellulosilyticus (strain DSM 18568 / NBRC 106333 / KACC 11606 / 5516J-15) TaxID=1223518 RepID=A0A511N5G3_DEIC1|nr:FAD-dependent oxidoreductase [Deinococcus cellulosilyticus]GEM48074.1 glycine oxidase ThiO [Deinococcus cellulosilyticus NBRC 106333 = KACC 11606]
MKRDQKVIVVGAGIMGSMIAAKLRDVGAEVTLLDAGFAGQATRASGGMLAPTSEARSIPSSWRVQAQVSLKLWQEWLQRFEKLGVDVGYIPGLGHAAMSMQEAQQHRTSGQWQQDHPDHPHGMAFFPEEGSVDPEQVLRALHLLCPVTPAEVTTLHVDERNVTLKTTAGSMQSDQVVLACGAWTSRFGVEVQARQGQALLLEGQHVDHALYKGRGYLVPRGGSTFVGATDIETWDVTPTRGARKTLLAYAHQHRPASVQSRVLDHKVGLRPYRSEPFVGPHPTLRNVLVATGHHRNGVLLAPVTAQVVTGLFMQASQGSYGAPVH